MDPDAPFPPYAFVPNGPWPHPTGSPRGHAFGRAHEVPDPIGAGDWKRSGAYLRGIVLFNAGYYWEAHEAWEGLWHAEGRRGATAVLLKALIKLAAAGVKVRQGQPAGVVTHARRAAVLIDAVREQVGDRWLGLVLEEWAATARRIAADPPRDPRPGAAVCRVFDVVLEPT